MMIDLHGITPLQKRRNDIIEYSYNSIENIKPSESLHLKNAFPKRKGSFCRKRV